LNVEKQTRFSVIQRENGPVKNLHTPIGGCLPGPVEGETIGTAEKEFEKAAKI